MEIPNGSISFGVEKEYKSVHRDSYFDYVLFNFFSLFPNNITKESIGYGHGHQPIVIQNIAQTFFQTRQLQKKENITWKSWKGDLVPFIFGTPDQPILSHENNQTIVHDDIIASAFYFLSGWQEIVDTRRDDAGRFLYAYSIQKELDIAQLPVVNMYFDILKTAIELSFKTTLSGVFQCPRLFISHDIDEWTTLWKQKVKKALRVGDWTVLLKTLKARIFNQSLVESFLPIYDLHRTYTIKTSFYFLPETKKYRTYTNADYVISEPSIKQIIREIEASNNEVGLHGSFFVHESGKKMKQESESLPSAPVGYRSHFLVFEMDKTPQQLSHADIQYDNSLGFPDQIGWRNSCSYPFYLFDFEESKPSSVLEIPLSIMECTLFFDKYLGLDKNAATEKCLEMVDIIEKHGGVLSLLWHNSAFDAYLHPGWAETLENVIQTVLAKGFSIQPGQEIASQLKSNG